MLRIHFPIMERSKKESPREAKPLLYNQFPPPFVREGDKAGSQKNLRFFWVLKEGGLLSKCLRG